MGYKLKRILIYPDGVTEKQVYPGTITETYTVPQATSTGTTVVNNVPIYKSGYKITNVVIEATGASNSTSNYGNINVGVSVDNTLANKHYRFTKGVGLNTYSNIEGYISGSVTYRSNLGGSATGTNTIKLTIGEDNGSLTVNGTTTNWTTTSAEKSLIQDIFTSSTVNAVINTTRGYIGPATYTVTYKPN